VDSNAPESRINHLNGAAIHRWTVEARQPLGGSGKLAVNPDVVLIAQRDVINIVGSLTQHSEIAPGRSQVVSRLVLNSAVSGGEVTQQTEGVVGRPVVTHVQIDTDIPLTQYTFYLGTQKPGSVVRGQKNAKPGSPSFGIVSHIGIGSGRLSANRRMPVLDSRKAQSSLVWLIVL
jgi:hypothetical protein